MYSVGIITSSDKGYCRERKDEGGPLIEKIVKNHGFEVKRYIVLPDEKELLQQEIIYMSDNLKLNLILTTGGTGFSERDITPEATLCVIDKNAPGISEAIRCYSFKITKRAMLSRGVSGIRKKTLIINLPGSPKACEEILNYFLEDLKHGLDVLQGGVFECAKE